MDEVMERNDLGKEINKLVDDLEQLPPESDAYKAIVSRLKELTDIRGQLEKQNQPWKWRVLENGAIVSGVVTLVGIAWVTGHERVNVITTRVFPWLRP